MEQERNGAAIAIAVSIVIAIDFVWFNFVSLDSDKATRPSVGRPTISP